MAEYKMIRNIDRIRPDLLMALQSNNNKTYVNVYYNTALVNTGVTTLTHETIKDKIKETMKEM